MFADAQASWDAAKSPSAALPSANCGLSLVSQFTSSLVMCAPAYVSRHLAFQRALFSQYSRSSLFAVLQSASSSDKLMNVSSLLMDATPSESISSSPDSDECLAHLWALLHEHGSLDVESLVTRYLRDEVSAFALASASKPLASPSEWKRLAPFASSLRHTLVSELTKFARPAQPTATAAHDPGLFSLIINAVLASMALGKTSPDIDYRRAYFDQLLVHPRPPTSHHDPKCLHHHHHKHPFPQKPTATITTTTNSSRTFTFIINFRFCSYFSHLSRSRLLWWR